MPIVNGTALMLRIYGVSQALQNRDADQYAQLFLEIEENIAEIVSDFNARPYGRALPDAGWYFTGAESAAEAMKSAIRVIEIFKDENLSAAGINCRVAIDSGNMSIDGIRIYGEPFVVASDLIDKCRANSIFITQRAAETAGPGFCFDEVSRLRLKGYEEKIMTQALCGTS